MQHEGNGNGMKNLLTALNAVMQEVRYVQKDKKNTFHGYKYAGEESLLEVLRPALVKQGIVLIPSVVSVSEIDQHGITHIVMEYTIGHAASGETMGPFRIAGCGGDKNKNGVGDKGTYKALTGANKYMLFKLFQIATGDDPENDSYHDEVGDNAEPGPPKSAPKKAYKKEATPILLVDPAGGPSIECGYVSTFFNELEVKMKNSPHSADWWQVNEATANMLADNNPDFPQVARKRDILSRMAQEAAG